MFDNSALEGTFVSLIKNRFLPCMNYVVEDCTVVIINAWSPRQIHRSRGKTDNKRHSWWIRNICKRDKIYIKHIFKTLHTMELSQIYILKRRVKAVVCELIEVVEYLT